MLSPSDPVSVSARHTGTRESANLGNAAEVRRLAKGEVLFRAGDLRTHVFRVEEGAICIFTSGADGTADVIEFAFPGDIVGLGYLDRHACSAQANIPATVRCIPRAEMPAPQNKDTGVPAPLTAAIEREVSLLRNAEARAAKLPDVAGRLAALFVTISRCNSYEGRDPTLIADDLKCGVVAGYLDLGVNELAATLRLLEKAGIIAAEGSGLRIRDITALEQLADGKPLR
ncbi:Crp/Fnr family transcriptional regulator [Hyphomicrobium sp. D-2]|uniref:Crp/Fnr family transcriptional regulator n=1 Tax=Hyphomicrobium sp. D-2 TaxID=3041621 RepID=UPI002455CFD0|nr:Crp/Fnr family transcriptional regulator [Hyphomicrobium sp. D-2]MDH4982836.1 Crp/Fnr family transcriptional regulator [Hyphomicrobium sp. D-2]